MPFNATNPVSVGAATRVDHYDRVFENTTSLYAGEMAITSQAANDLLYASSASQLARDGQLTYNPSPGLLSAPQIAPTDAAPTTPTAGRLYADSLVFAWATITNSGTPTLDADVNVSGLVDNGVGDVTVTFATAYGSTNYAASPVTRRTDGQQGAGIHSKASGNVRVLTNDNSASLADRNFDLIVVG